MTEHPRAARAEQRRVVLVRRPQGLPRLEDFEVETGDIPQPGEGELLVANRILSIDPAIRGFLDDRQSYLPPVALGGVVRAMVLGEVVRSRNSRVPEGALVRALAGWEEYSVLGGDAIGLETIERHPDTPLECYLGALGPAGLTAWIGLNEIGHIDQGQTVVVSAAAGAVGHVAGQIARLQGCRVIGLTGSQDKVAQLQSLGFHGAVDYRRTPDLGAALAQECPEGIDVYFDNVGGPTLEKILPLMKVHGRVVVCGMISDYNHQDDPYPVKTLWQLVVKRLAMRGFLTYDHPERIPEAQAQLNAWVATGALRPVHNLRSGVESAPAALIALLSGNTVGKTLVRV